MNNSRQWTEGMSRERFWQEAALRFFDRSLVAMYEVPGLTEKTPEELEPIATVIAKASFIFADAMAKQHGPDNVPRPTVNK